MTGTKRDRSRDRDRTPCGDCGQPCRGTRCRSCDTAHRRGLPYTRASDGDPKLLARWNAKTAIRSGRLVRQPCEVCGDDQVDAHHDDYDKPLDVRWLCRKHHRAAHRPMRCKHGHDYTPETTYINAKGWMSCRVCERARKARRRKEAV